MNKLKKSSFLEGAYIATACIFVSKVLGILYVIPFKQIIGDDGGALYGYAYNIYNIFLTISTVGIPFAISKLTSEYTALGRIQKKQRMYQLATIIIVVFSVLSFLICFCFSKPIAYLIVGNIKGGNTMNDVVFVIRCISFTLLIVPLLAIKRGYLQGHKYISQPSVSQVVEQLVRIIVILVGSYLFVYILKLPVRYAVGVSVGAAGFGALVALFYLNRVVGKNAEELGLSYENKHNSKQDKRIIYDIISCSIPFIIINLANTLYTTTDMILVMRTLPKLNFTGPETEFVSSVFTTWGIKFNAIISAVSTGLIVSLIPHMVFDYTQKDFRSVNINFNKALKIILFIILPLALFISLMSNSFWTVFYGKSSVGPKIISYSILVTILDCLYMILNSLMQSLNKKKIIYVSVISGLLANLILDVPLMTLFSKLGLQAYYGAITATLIGFIISNIITLQYLYKHMHIRYNKTIHFIPRIIISVIMVILIVMIFKSFLPVNSPSRLSQIVNIVITGIVSGGIYVLFNRKALKSILPDKLTKKLHL